MPKKENVNVHKCSIQPCLKVQGAICCEYCNFIATCKNACKNKPRKCGQYYELAHPEKVRKKAYNDPTADIAIGRVDKKRKKGSK